MSQGRGVKLNRCELKTSKEQQVIHVFEIFLLGEKL